MLHIKIKINTTDKNIKCIKTSKCVDLNWNKEI